MLNFPFVIARLPLPYLYYMYFPVYVSYCYKFQSGREVSSLLLAAAESESMGQQEVTVVQGEDGTSYIITHQGTITVL
jgi:hypothetical protein